MKFVAILIQVTSLFVPSSLFANTMNAHQTERLAISLQSCAEKLDQIKRAGKTLSRWHRPPLLASTKTKELYRRKALIVRAYRENVRDFKRHLKTADVITAEPDFAKKISMLRDYLSNCSRFADGILGFIDYAKTGRAANHTAQLVFENFIELARQSH